MLFSTMIRLLSFSIIALLAVASPLPAATQSPESNLSDEQLALLQRALKAIDAQDTYRTYIEFFSKTFSREIIVNDMTFGMNAAVEGTHSVIQGDTKNISGYMTATIEDYSRQGGRYTSNTYMVNVEVRFVDEQLYVLANYAVPDPTLTPLPETWTLIENPDDWPELEFLGLQDYLEDVDPFDNRDLLPAVIADIGLEKITLEDGRNADQITVIIGVDGFQTLMNSLPNNPLGELLPLLGEGTQMILAVILDPADIVVSTGYILILKADNIDMHILAPEEFPENTLANLTQEMASYSILGAVNEPLEPVSVPEME